METDFYFADIQVGITLKVVDEGALAGITDNQVASLRQMIYTTLNCFIYTRALFLTDSAELQKIDKDKIRGSENVEDGG